MVVGAGPSGRRCTSRSRSAPRANTGGPSKPRRQDDSTRAPPPSRRPAGVRSDAVLAARVRDTLPDSVFSIVEEARAVFGNHAALGGWIHVPGLDLLDLVRQQLHAMRIDAAEISFYERRRD